MIASKEVKETEDDNEYKTNYETVKDYFLNGQLYSEETYKNGVLEGTKRILDTSGNLVLTAEYKKRNFI